MLLKCNVYSIWCKWSVSQEATMKSTFFSGNICGLCGWVGRTGGYWIIYLTLMISWLKQPPLQLVPPGVSCWLCHWSQQILINVVCMHVSLSLSVGMRATIFKGGWGDTGAKDWKATTSVTLSVCIMLCQAVCMSYIPEISVGLCLY